jgi:hypothetical protein
MVVHSSSIVVHGRFHGHIHLHHCVASSSVLFRLEGDQASHVGIPVHVLTICNHGKSDLHTKREKMER